MKSKLLLPMVGALLTAGIAQAQIITNGEFEAGSASSWTKWEELIGQTTVTFDYTGDTPTGGSGSALRIQSAGDTTNGGIYQQVTLEGGHSYEVEGVVKEILGDPTSTWFEVFMTQTQPTDGSNVGGTNVTKVNTWVCDGYDGTFTAGCETPAMGQFTVPGSGSQTWYIALKSGVCCGGGPGEYVVDSIVITDLGAGPSFDAPPTALSDDFDDNDGTNNYGGEYRAFGGGDPGGTFAAQDASMTAVSEDAQGTTGSAGDYALHVFANTPLTGDSFIYYGAVASLTPGESGVQDLSTLDTLSFDIKLGNGSATTDWTVRLEDSGANDANAGNYNNMDLSAVLTTSYTTVSIPLADFVSAPDGGTIAPNLAQIDVITFAVGDVALLATNPDIYIDNLQITNGSASVDAWEIYN